MSLEYERVIYTLESGTTNRVRVILSGQMDEDLLAGLEFFVHLHRKKIQSQEMAKEEKSHG